MGWIHDRHMKSGGGLNRSPKNNGSQNGPLRKVIAIRTIDGVEYDDLECGHRLIPAQDIIGRRCPARRRCRKCKMGKPTDFDPGA